LALALIANSKEPLKASWKKHVLQFKQPSGTSRGVLTEKAGWFLFLSKPDEPKVIGIGEAAPLVGLSLDDRTDFEAKLTQVCTAIEQNQLSSLDLAAFPSIVFALESALLDLKHGGKRMLFDSPFAQSASGITINGLVWMGKPEFMRQQIEEKLANGFRCIKLKIGAIDFETELSLLKAIREKFSAAEVELRVDANGAFSPIDALEKCERLAAFDLHSIEQPIKPHQHSVFAELCRRTPLPIALDEELIGVQNRNEKIKLLDTIKPQYIILKPTLTGGFQASEEWINLAAERNIGWWITSALESNIGLNAIAQWTATLQTVMPQGLGTGTLYTNNFDSPLVISGDKLFYDKSRPWQLDSLLTSC
jgi:O-succinylbenzoate synthase